MIVEPAVADSITGSEFNPYIFRTARNSSQDVYAAAAAIAGEGVKIATFAPDYSFGWDGVAAFKTAAEDLGAEIVLEEFADPVAQTLRQTYKRLLKRNQTSYSLYGRGQTSLEPNCGFKATRKRH